MKLIYKIATILVVSSLIWVKSSTATEAPLSIDVYRADSNSFHVASTLVTGNTEAALIDAQFTLADAHNLVAKILRSGKKLTTIYISHGDPDFYFGIEVITQAFPDARVYSTAATLKHIKATVDKKLKVWGPKLGANGPTNIVYPEVIQSDSFTVDGHTLKIVGIDSHPERTYVWIPEIKAILGGIPVFSNLHLWMADSVSKEKRQQWFEILNEMLKFNPEMVVAGHGISSTHETAASIKYSLRYLEEYENALAKTKNSEELIKIMSRKFPNAGLAIALSIGAKVSKGEMTW